MIYLQEQGGVVGPFSEEQLRERVAARELPLSVMSWREGEACWISLARRWKARAAQPPLAPVAGVFATASVLCSLFLLTPAVDAMPLSWQRGVVALTGWGLLVVPALACSAWYWRNSSRATGRPAFLAVASALTAALGGLASAGDALILAATLEERFAAPNASVWTDVEAATLYVDGSIGARLAPDLENELRAHPGIERVVVDSGGGLLDDALDVGERIAERGLVVRVDGSCASACVALWASALRREMTEDSLLGLHQVRIDLDLPESWIRAELEATEEQQRLLLRNAGFSDELIRWQQETPPDEMTWVEPIEALEEGVEFQLVDLDGAPVFPPSVVQGL